MIKTFLTWYDLNEFKLLLRLAVETSSYVALYVQVSSAYLNPRWIGSYKYMLYTKNI
jgi:hypothetical protein